MLGEHAEQIKKKGDGAFTTAKALKDAPRRDVYFDNLGRVPTAIVRLRDLERFEKVDGPAILIDETQTILVEPDCEARMLSQAVLLDIHYK